MVTFGVPPYIQNQPEAAFERLRDDMTGYLAVKHPGNNIHVKSIAVLHALHVGNVQYRQ